jgi:hypothetical protein
MSEEDAVEATHQLHVIRAGGSETIAISFTSDTEASEDRS